MSLSGDADEAKVFRSDSTSADNSGTCIYIYCIYKQLNQLHHRLHHKLHINHLKKVHFKNLRRGNSPGPTSTHVTLLPFVCTLTQQIVHNYICIYMFLNER